MSNTCPVPTPDERTYIEIQSRIEQDMKRKVYAALQEATQQAQAEIEGAGLAMPPAPYGYFVAKLHQSLYCTLCEANPDTFLGGRADIAVTIIRNSQNIARHYWGANIEPLPRP